MITDQERVDFAMRYVSSAQQVVEQTHDAEAKKYLDHLFTSGMVAAPREVKGNVIYHDNLCVVGFSHTPLEPLLLLMPLFEADKAIDASIFHALLGRSTSIAAYSRGSNRMLLRADVTESPFVSGGILLHETGHAEIAFRSGKVGEPYDEDKIEEELTEEGQLHAMNARLWRLQGGTDYADILQKAFYRMGKISRGRNGFVGFECDPRWSDTFNKFLGTPPSPEAQQKRFALFVLYANLESVERKKWSVPLERMRMQVLHGYSKMGGRL